MLFLPKHFLLFEPIIGSGERRFLFPEFFELLGALFREPFASEQREILLAVALMEPCLHEFARLGEDVHHLPGVFIDRPQDAFLGGRAAARGERVTTLLELTDELIETLLLKFLC